MVVVVVVLMEVVAVEMVLMIKAMVIAAGVSANDYLDFNVAIPGNG